MYARLSTVRGTPELVDEGKKKIETEVVPGARQLAGFQGMIAIADRQSGLLRAITLWDTEEDMRASEERANQLRQDAADSLGATAAPEVEQYEVVYYGVEAGVKVS